MRKTRKNPIPAAQSVDEDAPIVRELREKPDLDPDLAARLRASSEERIAAQVQAARQQAAQQADARAEFDRRRRVGVGHRNAAREARIRLAQRHDKPEENQ